MENEQLNRSLELFNDFAEKGIDFVMEQSPLLCNEIILLAQITNLATFIFIILLSIALFIAVRFIWKNKERLKIEQNEGFGFSVFLTVITSLIYSIFIPFAACSMYNFLFATFAPRLYLFEYFTKLL